MQSIRGSTGFANRLTMFVACATLMFYCAIGISFASIKEKLNIDAAHKSVKDVQTEFDALKEQVRQLAKDYNNWNDVYQALKYNNIAFVTDNYGITAVNGDMFDEAIIFDGSLPEPLSWTAGGPRFPQRANYSEEFLDQIRRRVDALPLDGRATIEFSIFDHGNVKLASASRILPDIIELRIEVEPRTSSIGVIVRTITENQLLRVANRAQITGLSIARATDASGPTVAIFDAFNLPAAHFLWTPPRPGDDLLLVILPVLIKIAVMIGAFAITGAFLLRKQAIALASREADAVQNARLDILSGLPNRLAVTEHLNSLRNSTEDYAVILVDIDNFKNVNDLVGHHGGDELIRTFSQILQKVSGPNVFVSRIGGDEFTIICRSAGSISEVIEETVSKILMATERPFIYQGSFFPLTCSYGVCTKTEHTLSPLDLLRHADTAMYESKAGSGNQVTYYNAEIDARSTSCRKVEEALRVALRHPEEFYVLYQPIVRAQSNQLHSVEALARWESTSLGAVAPDTFIPVAEKCGLMPQLGKILLHKIIEDISVHPGLRVNINVSALQLLPPDFLPLLRRLLREFAVSPSRLQVELTESVAVSKCEVVSLRLRQLKDLGIQTALDDFGTGFSSINYLNKMPFDALKIDRSFVSGISSCSVDAEVICAIISLGRALGKSIVAEGVETDDDAQLLVEAGCHYLQGYFFSRPKQLVQILADFSGGSIRELAPVSPRHLGMTMEA